jgi:hypothetical protein
MRTCDEKVNDSYPIKIHQIMVKVRGSNLFIKEYYGDYTRILIIYPPTYNKYNCYILKY